VVLEVNGRGKLFYTALRVIVERTYRHTFHLRHKNKSSDSRSQVICKLKELFSEPCSMRPMRLTVEKTYNKKNPFKMYYY
jgi:hypothetical protein